MYYKMDYQTKLLLWNISKQTEIANAIKLGEQGCMYNYKEICTGNQRRGQGKLTDLKISYVAKRDNKIDVSEWNAQRVALYWDQNKPSAD